MKLALMIALLLFETAVSLAAKKGKHGPRQLEENHENKKRRLDEWIARSFVAIMPGIVYHTSTQPTTQVFKLSQNIYSTPLPPLSKISDVLTGQGPSFQTAITDHLVSPVSAYTSKLPTYEVTASMPSTFEYSDKTTYQIQPKRQLNRIVITEQPNLPTPTVTTYSHQRLQPYHHYHHRPHTSVTDDIQPQIAQKVEPLYDLHNNPYRSKFKLQPDRPEIISLPHTSPWYQRPLPIQNYQISRQPAVYIPQHLTIQPGIEYVNNEYKSVKQKLEPIQNPGQKPPQKPDQIIKNQGASSYANLFVDHGGALQPQANTHVTEKQQSLLHPLQPPILHQAQHERPHEAQNVTQDESQLMPQYRKKHVVKQPHTVHYFNYTLQSENQRQPQRGQNHFLGQAQTIFLYPNYLSQQNQFQQPQQYQLQHAPDTGPTQTQNQVSRSRQPNVYQIHREPVPIKPVHYYKKILFNNPIQSEIYHNFVSDLNKQSHRSGLARSSMDLPNNHILSFDYNLTYKKSPDSVSPIQHTPSYREKLSLHNQVGHHPKQALSIEESPHPNSNLSLIHTPSHIETKVNFNHFPQRPRSLNINFAQNIEFHGKYAHEIFKNYKIAKFHGV